MVVASAVLIATVLDIRTCSGFGQELPEQIKVKTYIEPIEADDSSRQQEFQVGASQ